MERTSEILVYIEPRKRNLPLLQAARRRAEQEGLRWGVVTVESASYRYSERAQEQLVRLLETAKGMGATVIQLEASNPADGLLAYIDDRQAEQKFIQHVFIGQSQQRTGRFATGETLGKALEKRLPSTATLNIMNVSSAKEQMRLYPRELFQFDVWGILFALLAVVFAYGLSELILILDPPGNDYNAAYYLDLIFLTAVAVVAVRYGLIPAVIAAIASFFIVEYALMQQHPINGLWGEDEAKNLTIFVLASSIIAFSAGYVRQFLMSHTQRQKRSESLLSVSEIINEHKTIDRMMQELIDKLEAELPMRVAIFLKLDGKNREYKNALQLSPQNLEALKLSQEQHLPVGLGTMKRFKSHCRFEPLLSVTHDYGVIVFRKKTSLRIDPGFGRFCAALADMIATGVENKKLAKETERARVNEEREKLRTMLLSSVSHDLKTPLVSIIGGLSTYHEMHDVLSEEHKLSLTQTALDEAERLESFINNILDITRLETGAVRIKPEWHQMDTVINRVIKRMHSRLRRHNLYTEMPEQPVEWCCDELLFEQVLQNLLDNAAKYSLPGNDIFVKMFKTKTDYVIQIRDTGDGIPDNKLNKVFDKYERLKSTDSTVAGTGLGLSICMAIIELHAGKITASNHADGGAAFTIYLPKQREVT